MFNSFYRSGGGSLEIQNIGKLDGVFLALQQKILFLMIKVTLNNMYMTVTNYVGKILFMGSGGLVRAQLRLSKKNTKYTAEVLLQRLLKKLVTSKDYWGLFLQLDWMAWKKKKIIVKTLQNYPIKILGIRLQFNRAFNGVRLSKRRRI